MGWKSSRSTVGKVDSVVAGTNISVDATNAINPIINTTGATGSFTTVDSKTVTVVSGIITDIT